MRHNARNVQVELSPVLTGDARRSTSRGGDAVWTRPRVIVAAIVVCVAYFLGAQLGLQLRLPGATPSVLWPPNALLTSALLLVPPRHWGAMLLAAFPAHLTLSMGTDWPATMIGLLFMTNCSEALLGATLLRRVSDAPARFDSLDRLFAFVVTVAVAAPVVTSFLDAAVVTAFSPEAYWDVWRARTFANVLTAVTVVPAVTSVAGYLASDEPWPPVRRMLEWTALGAGVLATWFAIPYAEVRYTFIPGAVRVPLAFLLPFIAWAAVRFGTIGASVTVLMTALLAIVSAAQGNSPFFTLSPGETLIGVQFVILAAALPHLALAAAIDERWQALKALSARLEFERLLGQLAHAFLDGRTEPPGMAYQHALRDVGERLGFDAVILLRREGPGLVVAGSWFRHPADASTVTGPVPPFPWSTSEILANREVLIGDVDDYPIDAHDDRRSFTTLTYKSAFALPLASAKEVLGGIGYVSTGTPMRWDRDLGARLRLVAEIFGSAMARQHAEDALVGSEMLKTAILSSLASGVAVLDRQGCVIAMNERWTGLARDSGLAWADVAIGEDLLARARASETREAERVVEGSLGVLSGGLLRCVVPHQIATPQGPRFWVVSIHPLDRPEGGAVVTYAEITERKRAELDAQTARAELAHMARVATLGELASSFAHQLNQPLTAIVANAQAGRRLIASGDRGGEVPSVLEDIAADGLRAGTVIMRLREMLRKDDPRPVPIDVATLVQDVAALVANDALIREVTLRVSVPPSPLTVHGDRIQLQQAMLNVLMNAFEAVGDGKAARLVEVDARATDGNGVSIEVTDTGPGLPTPPARIFEAFYTTKPYGMGMGLPIVRTIVEAHGGSIRAANSPRGGAVVSVQLPLASGEPA
jgi:C4-dicarboxylate-specific signal transduction histidine kinase/integral membrane sensor domain MASE1